jgi:hypothetical protein
VVTNGRVLVVVLKALLEQGVEGGVPSSAVECRGRIMVVQDVRLWAEKVVVIVVAALQLGGGIGRQGN